EQDRLRFEAIKVFALPDAIDQVMCDVDLAVESVIAADSHMVIGQIVEQIGSRVVDLILGEVALEAKRARELAEVYCQSGADRRYVRGVRLPDRAESLRSQLVPRTARSGLGRWAVHQIQSAAEAAPGVDVRRTLD